MSKKKDYARVAEIGCILCRHRGVLDTPAELHHIRNGGKRENAPVIPLCPEHHRGATGLHGLGTKGFLKHYGYDEADLLKETLQLLGS